MLNSQEQMRFEMLVLPHLGGAFNFISWLLRSGADAEEVAQEAILRVPRELEGCSFKEIAAITWIPIDTVMSTLLRACRQLHLVLAEPTTGEIPNEL
ncbi:MAG: hypothetical protein WAK48_09860 [Candidatus Acidiferrum sp.]